MTWQKVDIIILSWTERQRSEGNCLCYREQLLLCVSCEEKLVKIRDLRDESGAARLSSHRILSDEMRGTLNTQTYSLQSLQSLA